MLTKQRIITDEDNRKIQEGLTRIQTQIENNKFEFSASLEDIHLNIENKLKEMIGDAGGRLHTARSRNDQVAVDFKLYCRDAIDNLVNLLKDLENVILEQAEIN
jgi:argininosuccinate lyase